MWLDLNGPSNFVRSIVTAGKKVAPKIPAYCEEVYHFFIEKAFEAGEGRFGMLTQSTSDDFARTMLPLDKQIIFDDKPIYDIYIKPAIDTLNKG